MKRYRWLSFYIDTQRNLIKAPGIDPQEAGRKVLQFAEMISNRYGSIDLEPKFHRWFNLTPPALSVPTEYLEILHEVEGSFIHGDFYPSLTGACCLGERILNHLLLGVRDEHRASPHYKKIYQNESIDNWEFAIEILKDWGVLSDAPASHFAELLKLRNPSVHFGDVSDKAKKAQFALNLVYKITDELFGMKHPRFLMDNGEIYVRKGYEADPVTKIFVIPHCFLAGYNHLITNDGLKDDYPYPEGEITDEEFMERRKAIKGSPAK